MNTAADYLPRSRDTARGNAAISAVSCAPVDTIKQTGSKQTGRERIPPCFYSSFTLLFYHTKMRKKGHEAEGRAKEQKNPPVSKPVLAAGIAAGRRADAPPPAELTALGGERRRCSPPGTGSGRPCRPCAVRRPCAYDVREVNPLPRNPFCWLFPGAPGCQWRAPGWRRNYPWRPWRPGPPGPPPGPPPPPPRPPRNPRPPRPPRFVLVAGARHRAETVPGERRRAAVNDRTIAPRGNRPAVR